MIDKPSGISSARVLSRLKKNQIFSNVKIGHCGTLDPFARGLLVVLTGKMTCLQSFFMGGKKQYSGEILLGTETNSDDITGNVMRKQDYVPFIDDFSFEAIKTRFQGKILQCPPFISAIQVAGKRSYKVTRSGGIMRLKPREVVLSSLFLTLKEKKIIEFSLTCSSGFYVRALARDVGRLLSCGACLKSLRRLKSDPFSIENAHSLEDLKRAKSFLDISVPLFQIIALMPSVVFSKKEIHDIAKGKLKLLNDRAEKYLSRGFILGKNPFDENVFIGIKTDKKLHPWKAKLWFKGPVFRQAHDK